MIVPLKEPFNICTEPIVAPPGCLKLILGVKVYPLPELSTSRPLTDPFVTVALSVACFAPDLVGASITTVGGLVSL